MGRKRKRNRRRRKRGQAGDTGASMPGDNWLGKEGGDVRDWQAYYGLCAHQGTPVVVKDPTGEFTVYAGAKMDLRYNDTKDVDIQVVLADVIGLNPYSQGFRGRIWFVPAPDGGVWPVDVFKQTLGDIREAAQAGKKVLVYCLGGHGRTGTMLAGLLGQYEGAKDPVGAIRERYCKEAVEGPTQIRLLFDLIGRKMPGKYASEKGWWEYEYDLKKWDKKQVGGVTVYTPVNPTTGRGDRTWNTGGGSTEYTNTHPEAATNEGVSCRTAYHSVQRWDDKLLAPKTPRLVGNKPAPNLDQIKYALTTRYGDLERMSGLVKHVLASASLQVLPGWAKDLWWVYGDRIVATGVTRWECFLMYYGHETILDGHVTVEYGRTSVAPTLTGQVVILPVPEEGV